MVIEKFTVLKKSKYRIQCDFCGKITIQRKIMKHCNKKCYVKSISGKGYFSCDRKICETCGFDNFSPLSKNCNLCRATKVQENAVKYHKQRKVCMIQQ